MQTYFEQDRTDTLIPGSGEMADRIRAFPWESTCLGGIETWCSEIVSAVNLMLSLPGMAAVFLGPNLRLLYNDAYIPILDYKHPHALGQPAHEVWSEVWPILGPGFDAAYRHGRSQSWEEFLIPIERDGLVQDTFWTYSLSPIYLDQRIAGVFNLGQNVTGQRREAAALRESEARMNAIYSTSIEYIGLLSPGGLVLEINEAALQFDGSSRIELLGTPFANGPWFRHTPGAPAAIEAAVARATAGEHVHQELPLTRADGEIVTFDFSLSPVRDENGKIVYLVPEAYDISPLKRAQAMLIQNEKLAAVGRLASTIAHEINNPLESVTNLLYLARTADSEDPSQLQEYLALAERELLRVSAISSQTLRFHKQASMPRAVAAEELFSTVLAIQHGRLVNFRIHLEKEALSATPVLCFEGEIRQVLNNLVGNAIDAMGHNGGRLILRARESCHWPTGRPGLRLTVADTGGGIDPETLQHIFEPFFTTKGIAGTGLGLWVSQQIAERHHGALRIRSKQAASQSGTVFTLFLPFDAATR
jgi:PAS domain S-box-containing protein